MDKIVKFMFELLRFVLDGKQPGTEQEFTENDWKALFAISKKHDLAHIIATAIDKCNFDVPEVVREAFRKQMMIIAYRSGVMDNEYEKIITLLENENIDYVPLKGAVIKELYPESWMRTRCDIDILVRKSEVYRAEQLIREKLSYINEGKPCYHDISMRSENGVHLELHFSINENMERVDKVLSGVWDYTKEKQGREFCLLPEFFMFYSFAHMLAHFMRGGCGIRQIMDLYLLRKKVDFDEKILMDFIKKCEMERFYEEVIKLSEIWFEGAEHTEVSKYVEMYVINGGVYGSASHHIAIEQGNKGGKTGYILSRIFMKKKSLEILYPALKKYPFLYPFCTVARWTKLLKKDVRKRIKKEIDRNRKNEMDSVIQLKKLMGELEI